MNCQPPIPYEVRDNKKGNKFSFNDSCLFVDNLHFTRLNFRSIKQKHTLASLINIKDKFT